MFAFFRTMFLVSLGFVAILQFGVTVRFHQRIHFLEINALCQEEQIMVLSGMIVGSEVPPTMPACEKRDELLKENQPVEESQENSLTPA
jgi:hypothetical protein